MSDEKLSFLEEPVEQPVAEVVEQPVVETATEAAKSAPAVVEDGKAVPLATFLDIRDRMKAAESKLQEVESQRQPLEMPDPAKDPAGYAHFMQAQYNFDQLNVKMNMSEKFATKEHGKELVEKVRGWCLGRFEKDEDFTKLILSDADPYEKAIELYNQEQLLTEMKGVKPEDLQAFREWQAQQAGGGQEERKVAAANQPAATHKPAVQRASTKSITNAPGADLPRQRQGAEKVGPGEAFGTVFQR